MAEDMARKSADGAKARITVYQCECGDCIAWNPSTGEYDHLHFTGPFCAKTDDK